MSTFQQEVTRCTKGKKQFKVTEQVSEISKIQTIKHYNTNFPVISETKLQK